MLIKENIDSEKKTEDIYTKHRIEFTQLKSKRNL